MGKESLMFWAKEIVRFAKRLLQENRFREARHHLAAAERMFHDLETNMHHERPLESKMDSTFWEDFNESFADLAYTWVQYGLQLFSISKSNAGRQEACKLDEPPILFKPWYLKNDETRVTADPIQDTEQAKVLFNFIHDWWKRMRLYYSLEDHMKEFMNAMMDLNELYKYLAFYEEDIESQYTAHRLRAEALETLSEVLREMRPSIYKALSVDLLQELAEVQLEMMGLNLSRIYAAETSDSYDSSTSQKVQALGNMSSKLKEFGGVLLAY